MGKKQNIAKRKQELTAQLAKNRVLLSVARGELKQKLNVKRQLGKVVTHKPKALFAGSLVIGLLITLFLKRPRRRNKESKATTKSTMLLGWGLALLKPAAKAWLTTRAKKLAMNQLKTRRAQQTIDTQV